MAITQVNHIDGFFAIMADFKRVGWRLVEGCRGKRADLYAGELRVLELRRKERIHSLLASGVSEEEITEDMLGFVMSWELFEQRSDRHYSKRSFEMILPAVLASGAARRFYVECHEKPAQSEEPALVCDATTDKPILYTTFEDALAGRREGGEIAQYFFFQTSVVNSLIQKAYASPPNDQPPRRKARRKKSEGAQQSPPDQGGLEQPSNSTPATQEGNNTNLPDTVSLSETIPQPSQSCEGVALPSAQRCEPSAQNCEPSQQVMLPVAPQNCEGGSRNTAKEGSQSCEGKARKVASNKNKKITENLIGENILISAPQRVIDPLLLLQFDFSQPITPDAILCLARLIYPPLPLVYRSDLDQAAAIAREAAAAASLAEWPLTRQMGLRHLAATMLYHVDERSPCQFRAYCRAGDPTRGRPANPGLPMRLWQLKSELILSKMLHERETADWWSEALSLPTGLVETPPDIDLAALAGIDSYRCRGMDADAAQATSEWLTTALEPHGYEVRQKPLGWQADRGYALEIWYLHAESDTRRCVRFYDPRDCDLIWAADEVAPIGTLEFVRCLRERVRDAWQAA